MQILDTEFPDVKILCHDGRTDSRGVVDITIDSGGLSEHGIAFLCAEQRIYHIPRKGTFFGIHFQTGKHPQDKLIQLLSGRGLDYVIDLRKHSATYRNYIIIELNGGDKKSVYIPRGYGHAFLSLEDNTTQLFSVSEKSFSGESRTIRYDDPQIELPIPITISAISDQDKCAPLLSEIENDMLQLT